MLPRIAALMQLRGKYSTATRDYLRLTRAIDESQLSIGVSSHGTAASGLGGMIGTRGGGVMGRGNNNRDLNTLDDDAGNDDGDMGVFTNGRRGAERSSSQYDDANAARTEEYQRSREAKGLVKAVRASILFRKVPVALSRIERLLKARTRPEGAPRPLSKKARREQAKLAARGGNRKSVQQLVGGSNAAAAATSATPTVIEDDEMLDMMFMGTVEGAVAEGESSAAVTSATTADSKASAPATTTADESTELSGDDLVDAMMMMDMDDGAAVTTPSSATTSGNNALTTPQQSAAVARAEAAADHHLFGTEVAPAGAKAQPLHRHISLANVTRFLDTLSYFEVQRQLFLSQQTAEYKRAMIEARSQIYHRRRRLAKEYGAKYAGVMKQFRKETFEQFAANDSKLKGYQKQIEGIERQETALKTSIVSRPYTSARMWVAVLKFPALGEGADASLRIPYARALARMLGSIMEAVTQQGSNHCINSESPRFVSTHSGDKAMMPSVGKNVKGAPATLMTIDAADAVTTTAANGLTSPTTPAWILRPTRNATELLLLSLVRLAKVFDAITADCANPSLADVPNANPLQSPAGISMLADTLIRCQKIAISLMVSLQEGAAQRASSGKQTSEHSAEVLSLVGPTLGALDAAMTRVTAMMVGVLVGGNRGGSNITASTASRYASPVVDKLSRESALILISQLYQLKCFHPDSNPEGKRLLYFLIRQAVPQASTNTRLTLDEQSQKKNLDEFISAGKRRHMRREGHSNRDVLDDPKELARLERRRMDALLRSKRLAEIDQGRAEAIALTTPFNDLMGSFECLAHAAACANGSGEVSTTGLEGGSSSSGGDRRRGGYIINVTTFKPAAKEAPTWTSMLGFVLPHLGEAIMARAAADKSLLAREVSAATGRAKVHDTSVELLAHPKGLNIPQLIKLLSLSAPMLPAATGDRIRSRDTPKDTVKSASAFYVFLLSELKLRLSARLQQEATKRRAEEAATSRQHQHNTAAARQHEEDKQLIAEVEGALPTVIPMPAPISIVGIVSLTHRLLEDTRRGSPIHRGATELQQLCKGLLIDDLDLVKAMQPFMREEEDDDDEDEEDRRRQQQNKKGSSAPPPKIRQSLPPSAAFMTLLEGFRAAEAADKSFLNYLQNTF